MVDKANAWLSKHRCRLAFNQKSTERSSCGKESGGEDHVGEASVRAPRMLIVRQVMSLFVAESPSVTAEMVDVDAVAVGDALLGVQALARRQVGPHACAPAHW
jgi:hypothetical protein